MHLPTQESQEIQIWSLAQEDHMEKEMATHSSILAGKFHGQRSLASTVHGVVKSWTGLSTSTSPLYSFSNNLSDSISQVLSYSHGIN